MNKETTQEKSIDKALARLILANRVRELADYPRPVTTEDIGRLSWLFGGLASLVYGAAARVSKLRPGIGKRILLPILDSVVLVSMRVILHRWRVWRIASGTIETVVRNGIFPGRRYHSRPSSGITSYATTTDMEEPLIRVCLLLRIMGRHGACIEFLVQRLNSGLPDQETRRWLSFFLSEIRDEKAAALFSPSNGRVKSAESMEVHVTKNGSFTDGVKRSNIRYGIVLLTMFDTEVFRNSLMSLLRSDFSGEIVVVEDGNLQEKVCEEFCAQLRVKYVKNPTWTGESGVLNLGIEQLAPETDVIIEAQNDLLWPPRWFEEVDRAWEKVLDTEKVGSIQLGAMEIWDHSDPVLRELFLDANYKDLVWVLGAMTESPALMTKVGNIQMTEKDRGKLFGLHMMHWDGNVPGFVFSDPVIETFTRRTWSKMGGFEADIDPNVTHALTYHQIRNRTWSIRMNSAPIIHLTRWDTDRARIDPEARDKHIKMMTGSHELFEKRYGWDSKLLFDTYYNELLVNHGDQITTAINDLRFSDIEHVFDQLFERMERKPLADPKVP